ncbi:hypothetical protein [Streptomyces sp. NPDC002676]
MTVVACLGRWPTAPTRTELIHGVLLFTGDFDERDATTSKRTYPGRRVLVNADGNLEIHPAGPGLPRSLGGAGVTGRGSCHLVAQTVTTARPAGDR